MQYDSLKAKWPRYLMWVKLLKPKILIIYTVQFICNCPWTKYVQLFSHRPVDPAWIIEIIHKTKFRKSWDTKIKVRPTISIRWSGWVTDVPAQMQNKWEVIRRNPGLHKNLMENWGVVTWLDSVSVNRLWRWSMLGFLKLELMYR